MNAAIRVHKPIKWGRVGSYAVLIIFAIIYASPLLILLNTSLKTSLKLGPKLISPAT